MILYELTCAKGHVFEGWFRDSKGYDGQRRAGRVVCPACGDRKVRKAPMAPRLAKHRGTGDRRALHGPEAARQAQALAQLRELRQQVEENCDYVGERFADEARKIHYGEIETRAIYGETSDSEAETLADEGIKFGRIPWVPRADN
jgi:hypothetical protein